jgi:hypothetical protein
MCKASLIFCGTFFLFPLLPKWDFREHCKFFERLQSRGKQYHTSHQRRPQSQALKLK